MHLCMLCVSGYCTEGPPTLLLGGKADALKITFVSSHNPQMWPVCQRFHNAHRSKEQQRVNELLERRRANRREFHLCLSNHSCMLCFSWLTLLYGTYGRRFLNSSCVFIPVQVMFLPAPRQQGRSSSRVPEQAENCFGQRFGLPFGFRVRI